MLSCSRQQLQGIWQFTIRDSQFIIALSLQPRFNDSVTRWINLPVSRSFNPTYPGLHLTPSLPASQPPVAFGVVHIDDHSLVLDLHKLRRLAVFPDHRISASVAGQPQ